MIRFATICLFLMATATSALAFDCSGAIPLTCNGPTLSGTIGLPPEMTFQACGNTTAFKHKLYTLTVATAQEITVSLTGSAASFVEMVIFGGCDENACIATSPANSSVLPATCLEPGTYTIALTYLVEVVASYDISVSCVDCVPVAVDQSAWGALKSAYR